MEALSKRLLPHVRFPQMLVHELYNIENDAGAEFLSLSSVAPLLQDLIGQAYRFRALCPSRDSLGVDFKTNFYQASATVKQTMLRNNIAN
jgi:hypothetical protein